MTKNQCLKFKFMISFMVFAIQMVYCHHAKKCNDEFVTVTLAGRHRIRGQSQQTIYGDKTYVAFKGIPFAEAPVGQLRFKPPVPKTLPHCLDALTYGNVCLQKGYTQPRYGSEDCLFVNVFTPKTNPTHKYAVMVFIYGGGYYEGGIDDLLYGPDFLVGKDVVLVTFNYRLSAFGFMSLGTAEYPGNMALKDQQLALRWVNEYIQQFGGDPNRVTLFGESAGGSSVHLQMLTKTPHRHFQRAILMSGTSSSFWAISRQSDNRQRMMDFAKKQNSSVETINDLVDWLQIAPAELLLDSFLMPTIEELTTAERELNWAPVVENGTGDHPFTVQQSPWNIKNYESNLDVMFGYNSAEALGELGMNKNNPVNFQKLDSNFEILVPFKNWKKCSNEKAYKEVMSEARQFYFGNATIDIETFSQLVDIWSDIQFTYPVKQSLQHQIEHSTGRTYIYRISANSTLNTFKRLTNTLVLNGTSHADELCYIFKCTIYPSLYDNLSVDSTERKVQNHLLDIWINFAKFGTPTPNGTPLDFAAATAVDDQLVDISNNGLSRITNPTKGANDFWDALYKKYSTNFTTFC